MIKHSYYKKSREGVNLGRKNGGCLYRSLDDGFFKVINTAKKAYALGWIASDGSMSKDGRRINIILAEKDIEILRKIRNIICKEIKIKPHKTYSNRQQRQFMICVCSKAMNSDICDLLGISPGKKDFSLDFPELKKKFVWDFIRGYFDGDGNIRSIDKNPLKGLDCSISSNSFKIKNKIKDICWKQGIYCNLNRHGIYFSTKNAINFLNKLYGSGNCVHLRRKYNLYKKWKVRIRRKHTYMCIDNRKELYEK